MSDFVTLTCPSCGGRLEITKDVERFACAHCGNEHVVRRAGGIVSLRAIVDGLQKVQASSDRVGAELAIQRLTSQVTEAETRYKAAHKAVAIAENRVRLHSNLLTWIIGIGAVCLFALAAYANTHPAGATDSSGTILIVAGLVVGGLALRRGNEANALRSNLKTAQAKLAPAEQEYVSLKQDIDAQYRVINPQKT